jgi:hypothetical protein
VASVGRGRSREAARGSARAGTLGSGGGPRAPGSAPGGRRKGGQQGGYKGSNFPKDGAKPLTGSDRRTSKGPGPPPVTVVPDRLVCVECLFSRSRIYSYSMILYTPQGSPVRGSKSLGETTVGGSHLHV